MTSAALRWCLVAAVAAFVTLPASTARAARPDYAAQAKRLAAGVERAGTPDARQRALRRVMRALHVGVYTGRGKALARGEERKGSGIWVYDFELDGLAVGLGRRRQFTSAELGQQLALAGIKGRDGQPLSADALQRALPRGIAKARRARRVRKSLSALLFAELGRRAGRPAGGAAARFDPLQTWLLMTDIRSRHKRRATGRASARAAQAAPRPCFPGDDRIADLLTTAGFLNEYVVGAFVQAGLEHAITVGWLIDIQPTRGVRQGGEAHYGHVGPGDELQFQVGVQFLGDSSDLEVRCGPLMGLTFPKHGPIAGVPIKWDSLMVAGASNLARHGEITRRDDVTDSDGIATLSFRAKQELVAGIGPLREDTNAVWPEAHVWHALGNVFGLPTDAAGLSATPKPIGYKITYHADVDLSLRVRVWSKGHSDNGGVNHHGGRATRDSEFALLAEFPVRANAASGPAGSGELEWTAWRNRDEGEALCDNVLVRDHEITEMVSAQPGALDVPRLSVAPMPNGQTSADIAMGIRFTRFPMAGLVNYHRCGDVQRHDLGSGPMWQNLFELFSPDTEPQYDDAGNVVPGTEYVITNWTRGCPPTGFWGCLDYVVASREETRNMDEPGGHGTLTVRFDLIGRPRVN
jgi:hypothetical protein